MVGNRKQGAELFAKCIREVLVLLVASATVLGPVSNAYAVTSETSAAFTATQVVRQFTLRNTVVQANEALQSQVADVSGTLKGAAMVTSGNFPVDAAMSTVPTGFGASQRDGAGRLLGYCAWDNTSSSNTSSYLGGSAASVKIVYAVVSAGLDGRIDTSCASISSTQPASVPKATF